jgi:hypothetical protein
MPTTRSVADLATHRARVACALVLAACIGGCAMPTLTSRSAACTLAVLVAPTTGCDSTPLAPPSLDEQAKRFAPAAGTAQIYVTRPSIVGARFLWLVLIDGKTIGGLSHHTYLMQASPPGPHEVTIVTAESRYTVSLVADDGANLFLQAVPLTGFAQSRAQLRVLQPEQGKKLVLDGRRAAEPARESQGS